MVIAFTFQGFEVRTGELADKLITWHNLLNQTGYTLMLSNYPYQYFKNQSLNNHVSSFLTLWLRLNDYLVNYLLRTLKLIYQILHLLITRVQ